MPEPRQARIRTAYKANLKPSLAGYKENQMLYCLTVDGEHTWYMEAKRAVEEYERLSSIGFTGRQMRLYQGSAPGKMKRVR